MVIPPFVQHSPTYKSSVGVVTQLDPNKVKVKFREGIDPFDSMASPGGGYLAQGSRVITVQVNQDSQYRVVVGVGGLISGIGGVVLP